MTGRPPMSRLSRVIDGLLELTVVGSFTRIGSAVRRRMFDWTPPEPSALDGRTVVVTGPTSGLGRAATFELAALGARVVLVGRDEAKLVALQAELVALQADLAVDAAHDRFPIVVADMSSRASVRLAVDTILATEPCLDVLVDNAGAVFADRTETEDGVEATLATMLVGPFLLEAGLLPLLERTPGARVIAVTSGGMYLQSLPLDDLGYRRDTYSGLRAYARAKRGQVALMREWARREHGRVTFTAMHPGWVDTPGLAKSMAGFHRLIGPLLRTPSEGIDTIAWLAAHDDAAALNGGLFLDRRRRPFDRLPATRLTAGDRRRLWDEVVRLAEIEDPAPERMGTRT